MPQYSVVVNNARLDAIEATVGVSPKLRLYTGAIPTNCAAVATGTLVIEITLPSDWLSAASGASKIKLGTWSGSATGTGVVGYYRIVDSTGATTGVQGSAGMSGTEMLLDNSNIATSQVVTVSSYTINAANV